MEDEEINEFENETINNLIKEFIEQRNLIKEMISELEKIKNKVDSIFPDTLDKRFIRFFEEKIKSATELFKVILEMRKEIIKNTKDEIEIRRKIKSDNRPLDDESLFDIRKLADKVNILSKQKLLLEQKTKKQTNKNFSEKEIVNG